MKTRGLGFSLGMALSVIAIDASAFAATTVTSIQGPLQVNTGSGFHQVSGSAQVPAGASVMVAPGGSGEILYSDGCRIPVRPGSVTVVAPISPCAQGAASGQPDSSVGIYSVLGVAAVTGAVVGIAYALRNNNPPASP